MDLNRVLPRGETIHGLKSAILKIGRIDKDANTSVKRDGVDAYIVPAKSMRNATDTRQPKAGPLLLRRDKLDLQLRARGRQSLDMKRRAGRLIGLGRGAEFGLPHLVHRRKIEIRSIKAVALTTSPKVRPALPMLALRLFNTD